MIDVIFQQSRAVLATSLHQLEKGEDGSWLPNYESGKDLYTSHLVELKGEGRSYQFRLLIDDRVVKIVDKGNW